MSGLRARLLNASLFTAVTVAALGTAAAQDTDLEERVDRVEAKLDEILERLGDPETELTVDERQDLKEAAEIIKSSMNGNGSKGGFGETPAEELLASRPQGFMSGNTEVFFGGYVKLDASITDFTDGELPTNSLGRDFYIPSLIPVGGEDTDPVFDFNPRETRYFFGFKTKNGGHEIGGKIELDFQVTNDGNERVSNSFAPRMRQAFVTIDNWLFGQTWSTFQDVSALPDNLDFIGPTEGTVFIRQPMIRPSIRRPTWTSSCR